MIQRQGVGRTVFLWAVFVVVFLFAPGLRASAVTLSAGLHTDIEYGQADGESLLLDAFVAEGGGLNPVVVIIHGGGWVGGDKQDMSLFYEPLSEAGFTSFSVNYRLAPKHRWPACLDDVQTAVNWIKAHASDYKGDPKRIALLGYSAGGHLACMAAVKESVQAVVGIAPPTDHLSDSTRRGGLSECLQKLFDRPKAIDEQAQMLLQEISPINYVTSDLPPFLLVHGTVDQSVLYSQSVNFREKLTENNVPCELITIEGAPHRISEWVQYDSDYKAKIVDWLSKTIGDARPSVFIVNADGTGDYTTVQAAVDAVPDYNTSPTVIRINPGTYKEKIIIPRTKRFITFKGKNAETTVLTYNLYAGMKDDQGKELGTFRTPSVTIEADDFSAENITFENTAGDVGQAVAVTVIGDRVVFRNCRFLGWQDTLLDQTGRHYYENCYIAGHCDFIFGGGTAFFEKCRIHCLEASYITAASTPEHQPFGYVFSNCKITGEPEGCKTYLGRPWRDYAFVFFLNTEMSDIVRPEGWHNWNKPYREKTARYAEYNSVGSGANPQARVSWSRQLTKDEAQRITIHEVLSGNDGWNPISGTVRSLLRIVPASVSDIETIKKKAVDDAGDNFVYLFACFAGKGQDGLYLAYSENGIDWIDLGGPFFTSPLNSQKGFVNLSLLQGSDGTFHLVWQTALREDRNIGYAYSKDFVHWSNQKYINLMEGHDAYDVTDPTLFFDQTNQHIVVIWASTLPGNYYQAYQEDVEDNPRLWYTTTADFETFASAKPFIEPGYSVKKGVVIKCPQGYTLLHEDSRKMFNTLRAAFGNTPLGPWISLTDALPLTSCQNPAVLKINDKNIIYFESGEGKHNVLITGDFNTWINITEFLSFPAEYHYGSILKVNKGILETFKKSRSR